MKKTGILFALLMVGFIAGAQTVLLNVDRKNETKIVERGPNLGRFSHFYLRAGFLASEDKPGARIIYGSSVNLSLGFRKKYKVSALYSLGYDLELQYTDYKLQQKEGKIYPDTIINNVSGRLDISSLSFGVYNRFNFDTQRGNHLGYFLDLGVAGEWAYSMQEIAKNESNDGTKYKTVTSHLNYTNSFNAKAIARLGFSHLSFYASWRLTDLFKKSSGYPDMPRLIAGIELALF